MKLKEIFGVAVCLTGLTCSAQADGVRPVVGLGYDFGGDTLVKVQYTNGDTSKVTAGSGAFVSGGAYIPINDELGVQATVGWKSDSANGKNGKIDFSRYPIELLMAKHFGDHHSVNAGLAYHLNPTYSCDVTGQCNNTVDYENAIGFVAEYLYSSRNNKENGIKWAIRYTGITYTEKVTKTEFDGSAFGIAVYF